MGLNAGVRRGRKGVFVEITVIKRNGQREPYDANKINLAIEHASGADELLLLI